VAREISVGQLEYFAKVPEVCAARFFEDGEDAEAHALMDRVIQAVRRVRHRRIRRVRRPIPEAINATP